MEDHSSIFVSPDPPLATVAGDLDAMEHAQSVANTHLPGAAAHRDIAFNKVVTHVRSLQAYVTKLAGAARNEAKAISIIEAAGFRIRKRAVHVKPTLAAKQGDKEGEVKLKAKSLGRKVSYNWQVSTDGNQWQTSVITLVAHAGIQCRSGMRMHFRLYAVLSDGSQCITEPVSIFVK